MDVAALQKEVLEVWVSFSEDAEVLIQYVSREELQRIYRKARKQVFINHQKTEEYNPVEADKLLGRAAIKDWKGFTIDGKPFPCTQENIDLFMTRWNAFSRFINDTCVDLEALVQAEHEKLRKNSSTTSGQGSTTLV